VVTPLSLLSHDITPGKACLLASLISNTIFTKDSVTVWPRPPGDRGGVSGGGVRAEAIHRVLCGETFYSPRRARSPRRAFRGMRPPRPLECGGTTPLSVTRASCPRLKRSTAVPAVNETWHGRPARDYNPDGHGPAARAAPFLLTAGTAVLRFEQEHEHEYGKTSATLEAATRRHTPSQGQRSWNEARAGIQRPARWDGMNG
jgi:hypothetical protein